MWKPARLQPAAAVHGLGGRNGVWMTPFPPHSKPAMGIVVVLVVDRNHQSNLRRARQSREWARPKTEQGQNMQARTIGDVRRRLRFLVLA